MKALLYGALGVVVLLTTCSRREKVNEPDPQSLRKEIPPTEVETVLAGRRAFEYLIQAPARIESRQDVQVKFGRVGTVKEIRVRNGQRVRKGEVLAVLDYDRQQLQLQKAQIAYQEKQLVFRDQMLSHEGADSARQKRAEATIRITSGLAAAEAALREAELEYRHTYVTAAIDGTVSDLQIKPGNPVTDGQLFCRLHNPDELIAVAEVLETDVAFVKTGNGAVVKINGQEETGHVVEINPRVDEKTGLVKVIIRVTGKTSLLPGMRAEAVIKVPGNRHIVVPKQAVVIRSGRAVVFTAEKGLAKWNYVTTGRENGKEVEILRGLEEGKAVIITNNLQLAHDAPVMERRGF
ncbi:MAG: RND transporter [Cyclobacteriaceae bacterium]|nr:MAG: RND transporter [Cyclobacteriaceae bacterium]